MNEEQEKLRFCACPYPYIKHCFNGKKGKIKCYLKWLKEKGKRNFIDTVMNERNKEGD